MSQVIMRAEGLTRRIGNKALLADASLDLQAGEVLGIIGPNGAGKSTLLRLLTGLDRPDQGEIDLQGRPLAKWPAREKARLIGYLPQHFTPHWDYTVAEVLRLGLDRAPGGVAGLTALAASEGVLALLDRHWSTLSGGERARTLAAAVLAPSPPLILADEPAAALDIGQAARLMALLRARADLGAAVAVVVHDLNLAGRWCDRIALVSDGRIRSIGPPAEIFAPGLLEKAFGVAFERLRAADGRQVVVTRNSQPRRHANGSAPSVVETGSPSR